MALAFLYQRFITAPSTAIGTVPQTSAIALERPRSDERTAQVNNGDGQGDRLRNAILHAERIALTVLPPVNLPCKKP
jgi:hypothetical protein